MTVRVLQRKNTSTTDGKLTPRQISETARGQRRSLCIAFVDLTKAFDSVIRDIPFHHSWKDWLFSEINYNDQNVVYKRKCYVELTQLNIKQGWKLERLLKARLEIGTNFLWYACSSFTTASYQENQAQVQCKDQISL